MSKLPVDFNLTDLYGFQSWECWACDARGSGLVVPPGHQHRLYAWTKRFTYAQAQANKLGLSMGLEDMKSSFCTGQIIISSTPLWI